MQLFKTMCCIGCLLLSGVVFATPTQDDLRKIEAQLKKERQTQQEAKKKSTEIANEIKKVQKQMVRSAKAVQEKEDLLNELQRKLNNLQEKEDDLNKNLALTDKQLVKVASGLQTLALRPAEVVLLEPQSPLIHLRSKMMMNYALPHVQSMNAKFLSDLSDLAQTKTEIEKQATRAKTIQAQLNERNAQMDKLIKQKSLLQAEYDKKHNQSRKKIVSLANQAKDLKELLEKLEAEKKKRAEAEAKRKKEEAARIKAQNKYEQTATPTTNIPKGSFKKAKGKLNYPVKGQIIENFNDVTEAGLHTKGMRIQANSGSTVTNLYHGNVLFAGPFKSYGHLLIMDNGDDYLTLLAGMSQINVSEGQEILTGEPVGRLQSDGKLYLEIRKNGQAIDPKPWFTK
ncbi:MAG: peptidoglycan DD-metalloendopeptidase family protein [Alphaproteobacteria bacterium]|nr:peptidoglycan DD-metalloendopeptidase family protein [Alphaproteobacteria bacterium]